MELLVGGNFVAQGVVEYSLLLGLGLRPHHFVVDVGCGSGRLAYALRSRHLGRYVGTDILSDALDYARQKIQRPNWDFIQTRDASIPIEASAADFVCFFSVFTHLQDEDCYRFLEEAKRVSKPGGRIVFSFLDFEVPTHWPVFENSVKDQTPNPVLNRFHSKSALNAWASALKLSIEAIIDGSKPTVELVEGIAFDDGRTQDGIVEFGQSVCVVRIPDSDLANGVKASAIPAPTFVEANGQLTNTSVRGQLGGSDGPLLSGFTIEKSPRRVLLRAVGPSLASFGVSTHCTAPQFHVCDSSGSILARSVPMSALGEARYLYCRAFQETGAFALDPNARDAVLIITLGPGGYTVQTTGENAGAALLEIYSMPVARFSPDQIGATTPRNLREKQSK